MLRHGGVEERVDYGAGILLSVLIPEERSNQFSARLLDTSAGTIEALELRRGAAGGIRTHVQLPAN